MARTTPPRPLDITEHFPELRDFSRTATRLHPRPGAPAVADSSVGGPLLWPSGEAWPACDDHEEAIPLVPVAQLYRRDIPDYVGPDGTDVMQVLWCPVDHADRHYSPRVFLHWRDSAAVGPVLETPPAPAASSDAYLPKPCVVHPEQVREYQYADLLPAGLRERLYAWEPDDEEVDYQYDLSLAPGWKAGGYANWSLTDPHPMNCEACGAAMTLTFTADSSDWNGLDCSWRPIEEDPDTSPDTVGVLIGRGYALYVFRCPTSFDHPPATAMQ